MICDICGNNEFRKYGTRKTRNKRSLKNPVKFQVYQCLKCNRIKKGEKLS